MPHNIGPRLHQVSGALLCIFATAALLGGWTKAATLTHPWPEFSPMAANVALAFLLAGAALLAPSASTPRYRTLWTVIGALIAAIAALTLFAHAVTALAFALAAAVLILAPRARSRASTVVVRILTGSVAGIAAVGMAGELVGAPFLFPNYPYADVATLTTPGLVVLAVGLRSAWRGLEAFHAPLILGDDNRITLVGATMLVAFAVAAGVACFAILQGRMQGLISDYTLQSLLRRSEVVEDLVALRENNASIVATRPAVARNLRDIHAGRDDGSQRASVRAVVDGLLGKGFSAISYLDAGGAVAASGGTFTTDPQMVVALATPGKAELLWSEGFVLRHHLPVRDATGEAGSVRIEQPLTVLTRMALRSAEFAKSGDMGLCVRRGERLRCFPQRLNPKHFETPLVSTDGAPLPMALALAGETGVGTRLDYRSQYVIAAYGPVGDLGLGMVVKVDAAEALGPIREQLVIALALLLPLVAAGTLLLRSQVKPLATRLIDAQASAQGRNAELANANRAKDSFLASMSHELRTPLNAVIGFTGTLLMKLPGPLNTDQERQLRTIQTSSKHLLSLINDLLDLARIEAGKVELRPEDLACQDVVRAVSETLRPQAQAKGLTFIETLPERDIRVHTDRRAFNQIVINLAQNAIKFTERGSVEIGLAEREESGSRWVEIYVEDTGIGIHPEDREKLFDAFERLDGAVRSREEGTGLGLHVSRQLAKALGGRIALRSEYGQGSRFTLILPVQ